VTLGKNDLTTLTENRALVDDLHRAIEQSEFIPYYQPQLDPASCEIVGFEALARWRHPERGLLLPKEFLPTAAEFRVGEQIDAMIFDKGVENFSQLFRHVEATLPSLSFNASFQRILDPKFIADATRLKNYPGKVSIELSERIYLEDASDEFLMRVDTLRDYGFSFEVDEFGSGSASINALKRVSPERLKIDRRLIQPITESESARRLVRSIAEIGQALEIGVTAEGVETEAHFRILRDLGCDRVQGYHLARPMCFEDVEKLMRKSKPFVHIA
jgi:EAL domain-containing protein (putative c-di-GMP-specific phosphodiesterase class I)